MAAVAPWLLVAVVMLLVSGCGSSSTSSPAVAGKTRLRVDVVSVLSVARSDTVRCDPAGGSAPAPAAVCAAVREQPRLLRPVGGREHSCPAGTPVVFVAGMYAGLPVDASFSPCISGQEALSARWLGLVRYFGREPVVCSTRTLRLIASRPAISSAERGLVEQRDKRSPSSCARALAARALARGHARSFLQRSAPRRRYVSVRTGRQCVRCRAPWRV